MNWRNYIHSDPDVLMGKAVIKNTRISIDFILSLLGEGWTEKQILDNYPSLTSDSLHSVFAFVAECMREEEFYTLPAKAV